MTRDKERELFAQLAGHRPLREWLQSELASQDKILRVNPDIEQLRKAQGQAQFIESMLDKLTAAETAAKR